MPLSVLSLKGEFVPPVLFSSRAASWVEQHQRRTKSPLSCHLEPPAMALLLDLLFPHLLWHYHSLCHLPHAGHLHQREADSFPPQQPSQTQCRPISVRYLNWSSLFYRNNCIPRSFAILIQVENQKILQFLTC